MIILPSNFRLLFTLLAALSVFSPNATAAEIVKEGTLKIIARDPAGHGLYCRQDGKTFLLLKGTPEQMGQAQGRLLQPIIKELVNKIYLIGSGYTIKKGDWFFERMAEVERRTAPHTPKRFLAECDALAEASGLSRRDVRYTNFFPEMFHCSGFAVRGSATKDGRVLHARVLDYMKDIYLQNQATVTVFMPEGCHSWLSLGYAGFVGTVTAMNDQGLSMGEIGGRGEGDWDGMPMNFLMREVMEKAANVAQALDIIRKTPRTCIYYYVLSDKDRNMVALECTSKNVRVLEPGQQDEELPFVPEDTVLVSGKGRVEHLSKRLKENHGKIDVSTMIDIIKRPVAMSSNLHNAVFSPETLEMWFSDAGKHSPACNMPYHHCSLTELIRFFDKNITPAGAGAK